MALDKELLALADAIAEYAQANLKGGQQVSILGYSDQLRALAGQATGDVPLLMDEDCDTEQDPWTAGLARGWNSCREKMLTLRGSAGHAPDIDALAEAADGESSESPEARAYYAALAQRPAPQPEAQALPERDPSKPNTEQGLYRKYEVLRTDGSDGPGGKHERCEYFVLDVTHDPHAAAALNAYQQSVAATHPALAADMRERYDLKPTSEECEVRLWDSQWVNIVNHDNCYRDYDIEDAVAKAVRLTEEAMARNARDGSYPPPRKPVQPGSSSHAE